ncbi:hypothetical protein OO015_00955 [Thermomicrobium sp. 4228-Ro]|uniref:hypothetical protein n=1 Tax=Thermomicrobium sp. 4228-Ro TaxID=2993937 RepID=UPI0022488D65|nr:hypothetical protein [Thermomicrobium sp. 4228-Ro]MCX2726072.1 hypothetical protein [Thermomicrobium sp. 4228-Ro]
MNESDRRGEAVGVVMVEDDSGAVAVTSWPDTRDGVSIGDATARNVGGGGDPAVGAGPGSTGGRLD